MPGRCSAGRQAPSSPQPSRTARLWRGAASGSKRCPLSPGKRLCPGIRLPASCCQQQGLPAKRCEDSYQASGSPRGVGQADLRPRVLGHAGLHRGSRQNRGCRALPADGTAGPATPCAVRTALVEPSRLAGRTSGEVDHPAGDVESVVGQTLVKARHQRQLHRHRKCHPAERARPSSWRTTRPSLHHVHPAQPRRSGRLAPRLPGSTWIEVPHVLDDPAAHQRSWLRMRLPGGRCRR